MLAVEFGLWELSGALPSAVACLQFVALRLVVTRVPLVPNKDLIFVGAGIGSGRYDPCLGDAGGNGAGDPGGCRPDSGGHSGDIRLAVGPEILVMRAALRHPLFWILAAAAGLRLAGLVWGLPASDGWDDDGFVPRNFLTALALTYKPGSYFTYPPLHAILLAALAAPGIVLALLQAPSFHQADVIGEFTKPGTMTFFAVIGRLVNLMMSLGIIWAVGGMARLMAGRRAGLFAAGAAALNFGLTYYGQVGNLDVPYLFWGALSLLWSMRAVTEQRPKLFWAAALFAGASIATKDQAYALFLLSLPVFLFVWFAADRWPRAKAREIIRTLLPAIVVALLMVLLVDGAITNASGFARRIDFLAGPASGDYAEYLRRAHGLAGLAGRYGKQLRPGLWRRCDDTGRVWHGAAFCPQP